LPLRIVQTWTKGASSVTTLASPAKSPDDHDVLSRINELVRVGTKVFEVVGHRAEDLLRHRLGARKRAFRRTSATGLMKLDLWIEAPEHVGDVVTIECLNAT
jgi:hypothetical protein